MAEFSLSDGEKLILVMLGELFERLDLDEHDLDSSFIQKAIYNNNMWAIPWRYAGIPFENQDTPAIVSSVVDVLDMWSFIESNFERLGQQQKTAVIENVGITGEPKFLGFDGNNESEYYGVASFLIEDMGRFGTFQGRELNSHMPVLEMYGRMLEVFKPIREELMGQPMSFEQLEAVLREQIHPEYR